MIQFSDERHLAAVAVALGARRVRGWSDAEDVLTADLLPVNRVLVQEVRRRIARRDDPLGDAFCELRSAEDRRPQGATYTPRAIVSVMVRWAAKLGKPARIVDPGTGSARFLVSAGRRFKNATLIGVELDPLAALLARAHLAAAGFDHRAEVIVGDYRRINLPRVCGPTLFLGNPP